MNTNSHKPSHMVLLWNSVAAIDIIVGGPPCQDFTKINAQNKGVVGTNGRYLKMAAEFIVNVQKKQSPHHVWYLIENVVLRGDDLEEICKAFGDTAPMRVDSYHFSPCNRNRHYFVNVSHKLLLS